MVHSLAAIGGGLSVFLLLVLGAKRPWRTADAWLAIWFAAQAFFCLSLLASAAAPPTWSLPLLLSGQLALLLLGPAQYLYAASTLGAPRRLRLHASLLIAAAAPLLLLSLVAPTRARGGAIEVDVPSAWLLALPAVLILASALYPIATLRLAARRRAMLEDQLSRREAGDPGWLRLWACAAVALLLSFALLFVGLTARAWPRELHMSLTLALLTVHLAYVGLRGLTRPGVIVAWPEPGRGSAQDLPAPDPEAAAADYARVQALFESEKPQLDPDLTAQVLADRLGWAPERLTCALRLGGKVSFFDAVNAARVRELQALAADARNAEVSLLALAYDAGFGSKSALYEAFQRHAGSTPAAWRRAMRIGSSI